MTDAYEPITPDEFDKRLLAMLEDTPAQQLLAISGVYEIISEDFNEGILIDYELDNEHYMTEEACLESFLDGLGYSGRDIRTRIDKAKHAYDDDIMLREDYNNYTDALCKAGEISQYLYDNIDNPF